MFHYKTIPTSQNKSNIALTVTFGACGILLYLSTILFPSMPLPWLAQLLSVCLISGCLYCITWIIKGKYMYVIEDSDIVTADGESKKDLVIVRVGGKNSEALCRIGIDEITEFDRIIRVLPKNQQNNTGKKGGNTQLKYTSNEKIEHITDLARVRKTYKYQVDLITRNETVIVTDDLVIRLTYSKCLEDVLKVLKDNKI